MKLRNLFVLIIASSFSINVFAAGTPIQKTEVFTADAIDKKYDFQTTITENGQEYSLGDVNYEVLSKDYNKTNKSITKEIEDLYTQKYNLDDKNSLGDLPETKQEGNLNYKLTNISYEPMTITDRHSQVETKLDDVIEGDIQDEIDYEYTDPETRKTLTVKLKRSSAEKTGTKTIDRKSFTVIFHRYDAGKFLINDKTVALSSDNAVIDSQYYADVKAESIYKDDNGYISDMVWDGDVYTENGETCRNALATLTEEVDTYTVSYSSDVELPDTEGYRAILTYSTTIEDKTQPSYTIEATAKYEPVSTFDMTPVYIGAGIVVLAVAIAIILAIVVKKRKRGTLQ